MDGRCFKKWYRLWLGVLFKMWKVIYIAKDISLAINLEKILKSKGIITILNQLEISEDELNGNVEILVSNWEAQEAMDIINQAIIYNSNLLDDIS